MQCIEEAKTYAERKLTLIIEREGDCGGARREAWYLERLNQEAVHELNFAQLTQEAARMFRQDTQQSGVKERRLTSHNVNRQEKRLAYECTPIVPHSHSKCNRRI